MEGGAGGSRLQIRANVAISQAERWQCVHNTLRRGPLHVMGREKLSRGEKVSLTI